MHRARVLRLALALSALAGLGVAATGAQAASAPIRIRTLSNRADLVSAGNALVAIALPRRAQARRLKVMLNGRNVTRLSTHRSGSRLQGVVNRLRLGCNRLVATAPRARGARLTITNHPNGGPV